MAMLAEPRQRKRYNLVPRGKALYEDDSRFGTKMLEKMGWSKGKGLGPNENGAQDFVRVRYKNDAQGFGYEDRDDQWTQHEESFTGLLKTLNGEEVNGNASPIEEAETTNAGFGFSGAEPKTKATKKLKEKFSGESLEAKSKQSKARVHYKKFTRGKDLSRYSEKDLANIFGRKDTEADDKQNALYQQLAAFTVEQSQENKEAEEQNSDKDEKAKGDHFISSGLSVGDYFKQKMEALKHKLKKETLKIGGDDEQEALLKEVTDTEDSNEAKIKEKKKKRRRDNETAEGQGTAHIEEPKRKKQKKDTKVNEEKALSIIETISGSVRNAVKESKRKTKASNLKESPTVDTELNAEVATKKKKNKNKSQEDRPLIAAVENTSKSAEVSTTKKSKKHKNKDAAISTNNEEETTTLLGTKPRKLKDANETTATAKKSKKLVSDTTDSNSNSENRSDAEKTARELFSLDDLIAQRNSYFVYTISSFCAEKFRNTDLNRFGGSNMAAITGYSLSEDLRLDIKTIPGDKDRITQLWNCTLDKYKNAQPKTTFYNYVKQVKQARKAKVKPPRFQVKTWKRKHAFQGL